MDFESPDVEKDFPGLYASEIGKRNQESEYSDEEKLSKKDLLIGKRRDKKDSKKDKGYVAFEGESSDDGTDDTRSPGKNKKLKTPFKFPGKDKKEKSHKLKEIKEVKKEEDVKDGKKEGKEEKKKKKKEKKVKLGKSKDKKKQLQEPVSETYPVFGVPLHLAVERSKCHDGIDLPAFFRECIDYIEEHGIACEGIYRISGVKSKVQQLKTKYNQGERVYLYEHEPHTVASLIKQFLRELPQPVLTQELSSKFEDAVSYKEQIKRSETLKKLVDSLPVCNRLLLSWVFVHMNHVIKMEKTNKMSLQNVIIVLGPTMQISHHVLEALFALKDVLFKGEEIKKYQPIKHETSRQSLELPDTPAAIEEELGRQESFLNQLHAELNAGLRDKQKEEQLWEVQRVVTQLKRKLRFLKQSSSKTPTEDASTPKESSLSVVEEEPAIDTRLREPKPISTTVKLDVQTKDLEAEVKIETKPIVTDVESKVDENITTSKDSKPVGVSSIQSSPDDKAAISIVAPILPPKTLELPVSTPKAADNNPMTETTKNELNSFQVTPAFPDQALTTETVKSAEHAVVDQTGPSQMDPIYRELWLEDQMLALQEEELNALNRELQRKIDAERMEVERLKGDISDYQQIFKYKQYSIDSSENSSDSESSESQDEEDGEEEEADEGLEKIFEDLLKENSELEIKNADLLSQIYQERDACMDIKVQIKLMQQLGQPYQMFVQPTRS